MTHDVSELLKRVIDDTQAIQSLTHGSLNLPLEKYLDITDMDALCDSLSLEPTQWSADDLERILIIRDELYNLRNSMRDQGDEGEHSIERILSGMDRLYADLERALVAMNNGELKVARNKLALLQSGPDIETAIFSGTKTEIQEQAHEVLTQTRITLKQIKISISLVEKLNINVDLLKKAKLHVQRLSASAFAIKMSFEHKVVFEGVIRFLNDGADRVIEELKQLATQIKGSYNKVADFLTELDSLIEKGGRFVRLVSGFLKTAFSDDAAFERNLNFSSVAEYKGTALNCGILLNDSTCLFAGDSGRRVVYSGKSKSFVEIESNSIFGNINSGANYGDNLVLLGTDHGLKVQEPMIKASPRYETSYQEEIVGVAVTPEAIVTASRQGFLRQWVLGTRLAPLPNSQAMRIGPSARRIFYLNQSIYVAIGEDVVQWRNNRELQVCASLNFRIMDMCIIDNSTIAVCGLGRVALINVNKGTYANFLTTSGKHQYSCIAPGGSGFLYAGTQNGEIMAFDLDSGEELGQKILGFPIRGITTFDGHIAVYGGDKGRGVCLSILSTELELQTS